jgi:hypothetical protein
MTNVIHKFLIYLSIYFYLTCFGLFLAHLQRQMYKFGNGLSCLVMVSAPVSNGTVFHLGTGAETIP